MTDWLQKGTVSDVQSAIQSQVIQTALEKYNSVTDDPMYGFPKAIRLVMTVADSGNTSFFNARFNAISFNYGPFVARPNATPPLYDGVIVGEPGVYRLDGQFACLNGAGNVYVQMAINGNAILPDGSQIENYNFSGASAALVQCTGLTLLRAGDIVTFQYVQAVAINTLNPYVSLTIQKEVGR